MIPVDPKLDKAQRIISTSNLNQFAGVNNQLLVVKETHRPIIMDGSTLGGAFFCASTDEVQAVQTTANNALTKSQADAYYLGITAKATSAATADSAAKLTVAKSISISGGATATAVPFDGSASITLNVTSIDGSLVTGTVANATNATYATNATNATTANSATTATTATNNVLKSGNRGTLNGYESTVATSTITQDSQDSNYDSGNITVSDGTTGTAWTKVVKLSAVRTITLGSNWVWANGEAPEIKAPALLVCHWNNDKGFANVLNGAA